MSLQKTKLKTLDRDTLERLTGGRDNLRKLTTIDLSERSIQEIAEGTFANLTSLRELILGWNQLERIDDDTFRGLSNLETLQLGWNRIAEIAEGTFGQLRKLKKLYLGWNQLKRLDGSALRGLQSLEKLDLSGNQISQVETNAFANLPKLKDLSLNCNLLKRIEAVMFHGLSQIEILNLSDNLVAELAAKAFVNMAHLKELSLSRNQLKRVDSLTFVGLPCLALLFLQKNQLAEIERELFQDLKAIKLVHLDDNSFVFKYLSFYDSQHFLPWNVPKPKEFLSNWAEFLSQLPTARQNSLNKANKDAKTASNIKNETSKNADVAILEKEKLEQKLRMLTLENERLKAEAFQDQNGDSIPINGFSKPRENDKYGRYERGEFLGNGTFGSVFQVRNKDTGIVQAMKLIEKVNDLALNQLKSFAKLKHENVLGYLDFFDEEISGKLYTCVVVEYCENGDLRKHIKKVQRSPLRKIREEKTLSWMIEAAKGLCFLHSKKIAHLNIKPSNLLLDAQDVIKIGDMSLKGFSETRNHEGSPPYMSPEQYNRTQGYQENPFKTDVWALGCVLYELIHLTAAFSDKPRQIWKPAYGHLGSFTTILPRMLESDSKTRLESRELVENLQKIQKLS